MDIKKLKSNKNLRGIDFNPDQKEMYKNYSPISRDVRDYVKIYKNLTTEVCNQTITELKRSDVKWSQHTFYDTKTGITADLSGDKELDVSYYPTTTRDGIMLSVYQTLLQYVTDIECPWYNGWSGYTGIRWNKYLNNRKMASHCDHIVTIFDGNIRGIPTLTVLGALNDDYEGGEFVMWDDTIIPLKQGEIIVFPSIFLYPHRVDPVTKGERYSFVSWVW